MDDRTIDYTNTDKDLTDADVNRLLSCCEEDILTFQDIDARREAAEEEEWHTAGQRGRKLSRIMQYDELPDVYKQQNPLPYRKPAYAEWANEDYLMVSTNLRSDEAEGILAGLAG